MMVIVAANVNPMPVRPEVVDCLAGARVENGSEPYPLTPERRTPSTM
jgi:hypothetical protein